MVNFLPDIHIHCIICYRNINLHSKNDSDPIHVPSTNKFRSYASQFSATFAINILKFTSGTFSGFTTILLADLYKGNSDIKMTRGEITWFSMLYIQKTDYTLHCLIRNLLIDTWKTSYVGSHCFALVVGFLASGLLAQNIGSRKTMLIATIIFIICCLIFHYATTVTAFLTVQAIVGLNLAMSMGPSSSYATEIAEPNLRSILLATGNLSIIMGTFFTVLLASFIHWRTIILVNITFPILGFVAIYIIPESPQWLASKIISLYQDSFDKKSAFVWNLNTF